MKPMIEIAMIASLGLAQQDVMIYQPGIAVPDGPQARMRIFSRAGADVVKGAAYSAESLTEHTQVLADGNRIKHTNQSFFARDTEGRTRRETTIQGLGPVGQTVEPVVSIFIDDPVAKVHYTLDSRRKVAMKSKVEGAVEGKVKQSATGPGWKAESMIVERKIMAVGTAVPQRIEANIEVNTVREDGAMKREELGTRTIEGVTAKGTRLTLTIAAGEVGNERPLEVVTETWYSDEIKAVVLSRHTDPRSGEMVNRLTNVKLGNPARSLFEPPVDYKVEEVSNMRMAMPLELPAFRVKEDR